MKPINKSEANCSRTFRNITVRPITHSGISKLEIWFKTQTWDQILMVNCVNKKVENLQNMVCNKVQEYLPIKNRKIAVDDQPWYTEELKNLKRKKSREYNKNRKSEKYMILNNKYEKKLKMAKRKYKKKTIDDVLTSSERQWYSKLKKMTNFDQQKYEPVQVEAIESLPKETQANIIADKFSSLSNEYKPIDRNKIKIP